MLLLATAGWPNILPIVAGLASCVFGGFAVLWAVDRDLSLLVSCGTCVYNTHSVLARAVASCFGSAAIVF